MLGKRVEEEDKELDVDFAVVGVPSGTLPRRPNVVSRRAHSVKFIGYVREVKDDVTSLDILAEVFVMGPYSLAPDAHESRRMRLWGANKISFPIPLDSDLPYEFEIIVEEKGQHDEHLGQGPDYVTHVTIHEEAPARLKDERDGAGATGDQTQTQAADDQNRKASDDDDDDEDDDTGHRFTINFVAM